MYPFPCTYRPTVLILFVDYCHTQIGSSLWVDLPMGLGFELGLCDITASICAYTLQVYLKKLLTDFRKDSLDVVMLGQRRIDLSLGLIQIWIEIYLGSVFFSLFRIVIYQQAPMAFLTFSARRRCTAISACHYPINSANEVEVYYPPAAVCAQNVSKR